MRTRLRKLKIFLWLGSVYLLAGNVLLAFVEPGAIRLTDDDEKGRVFQFLGRASPELISFLQCVGALAENTNQQKRLTTRVECWIDSSFLPVYSDSDIEVSLRFTIGNANNSGVQCAVFPFGGIQFLQQECDDNDDGLRVRSLSSGGVIKRSIPNRIKVKFKDPLKPSDFQLLVYVAEENPIWYIVDCRPIVQIRNPQTPTSDPAWWRWKSFFDEIYSTLMTCANVGAQKLAPNAICQSMMFADASTGQSYMSTMPERNKFLVFNFLNNPDEEFVPLARQVGLLAETGNVKTLAAPFTLKRLFLPCPSEVTEERNLAIRLDFLYGYNPSGLCAVKVLGDARLAPEECDDNPNADGLHTRSFPEGWVLKHRNSVVNIQLSPWEGKDIILFELVLFSSEERPEWKVQEYVCFSPRMTKIIKVFLELNDSRLRGECKKVLVGDSRLKMQDISSMESGLNGLMADLESREHLDLNAFSAKSYSSNSSDWRGT
jgi:hypothetical protein